MCKMETQYDIGKAKICSHKKTFSAYYTEPKAMHAETMAGIQRFLLSSGINETHRIVLSFCKHQTAKVRVTDLTYVIYAFAQAFVDAGNI